MLNPFFDVNYAKIISYGNPVNPVTCIWDGTSGKSFNQINHVTYNVSIPMSNDCNCFVIDKCPNC